MSLRTRTAMLRLATISLCAALFSAVGCEKSSEPPPHSTEGLSVPVAAAPADPGVLRDLASYTPAAIPKIGESAGGSSAGGDNSSANTEAAVQDTMSKTILAMLKGEFQTAFELHVKDDVKALTDDTDAMSLLNDTYEKVTTILRIVGDKTGQPIDLAKYGETILAKVNEHKVFKVDALDANNATLTIEMKPEFIRDIFAMFSITTMAPEDLPLPPQPPATFKRVNGKWLAALPAPMKEEEVVQMKIALKAVQPVAGKLIEILDQAKFTNMNELSDVIKQAIPTLLPEFMAKYQEAATQMAEEAANKKPTESADGGKKEEKKDEGGK